MHRTTLHYNKPLLRQAVRGFWWRVVGFRLLIAFAVVAFGLVDLIHEGDTSWFTGVLGSVFVFGICFLIALYAVHYRNAVQKLRAMGVPQGTLEALITLCRYLPAPVQHQSRGQPLRRYGNSKHAGCSCFPNRSSSLFRSQT